MDATSGFAICVCVSKLLIAQHLWYRGPLERALQPLYHEPQSAWPCNPLFVTSISKWSSIVHELHLSILECLTHVEPHQGVHVTFLGFIELTLTQSYIIPLLGSNKSLKCYKDTNMCGSYVDCCSQCITLMELRTDGKQLRTNIQVEWMRGLKMLWKHAQ